MSHAPAEPLDAWVDRGLARSLARSSTRRTSSRSSRSASCKHDPTELVDPRGPAGAVAVDLRPGLHARRRDPDRRHAVSGLHGARHPRAERAVRRDLLRRCADLGAGPRHHPQAVRQPDAARGPGARQGARPQACAACRRSSSVYTLAFLLGVQVNWHPLALAGVFVAVLVGAACFRDAVADHRVARAEPVSGSWASDSSSRCRCSSPATPSIRSPSCRRWLHVVARLNPLSYEVDALRALMIPGGDERVRHRHGFRRCSSRARWCSS